MRPTDIFTCLLIVGGVHWLIFAGFHFGLVTASLGGESAVLSSLIYALVGLGAGWQAVQMFTMEQANRSRLLRAALTT